MGSAGGLENFLEGLNSNSLWQNSQNWGFLFLEFVQSNFETLRIGGGQVFVIGNFI